MSYKTAVKCFAENIRLQGGARGDPNAYNLHNGLTNLVLQIEKDMRTLQAQNQHLSAQLEQMARALNR